MLCSDIPKNSIMKWQDGPGLSLFLKPSGYLGTNDKIKEPGSNGLLLDPEGRLVLMQHGERRVARLNKDNKTFEVLADRYEGKRFNSPNDGVYHSNGDLGTTRSALWLDAQGRGRLPGYGNGLLWRLSFEQGRETHLADQGNEQTQWYRLRMKTSCTSPTPTSAGHLDGVPGQGRRTLGEGRLLRLHQFCRQ